MSGVVKLFERTWVATSLFLGVTTVIWWKWLSWESAQVSIIPTFILTPILWWWLVGRRESPRLVHGLLAGALIGPLTQVVPHTLPMMWQSVLQPGPRNGEEQAIAIAAVYFYGLVGIGAAVLGTLLGLLAALVQKRTGRWMPA